MKIAALFRLLLAVLVGVASLRAAATPPLEAYGELPAVEDFALSPSGTHMAALSTVDGKRMIMVYDADGSALSQRVVGDVKIRSMQFVSDDLLLVMRSSTESLGYGFAQDKFEFYQAMLVPVRGTLDLVFANERSLVNAVFGDYGVRYVDGRPKAYFGAIELARSATSRTQYVFDHGRPSLYEVDLLTNRPRKIDGSPMPGRNRDWLLGSDGEVLARFEIADADGKWTIVSGGRTIAEGTNPLGRAGLLAVGPDGTTIIYRDTDTATGVTRWYEVPVDGSAPPGEFLPDVDVKRLYEDRETGRVIGYVKDNAGLEPVFFDAAMTKRAKAILAAFPGLQSSMVDWTTGLSRVVTRTEGNRDSGTYYFVDLDARRAQAVALERVAIGPDEVGPVSLIKYTASDGLELDGILTLPPGRDATMLPLIMLPHGGPHLHDQIGFDWWAQAFASRGYAVFQPNFRGSTNRDAEFVRAGYGEWGRKMQTDLSDGLKHLADQGIIDPKRACIVGASYGGYAALAGVTLQNGIYRCAVSVAGVSDVSLMSRLEQRESGDSRIIERSLEQQLGPSSRYKEISPRHHADRADAPILLIHGRDDTVVAYSQSEKMADALKDAGKPFEFIELAGEDHWLSLAHTRLEMLKASVAFVEQHNPPN